MKSRAAPPGSRFFFNCLYLQVTLEKSSDLLTGLSFNRLLSSSITNVLTKNFIHPSALLSTTSTLLSTATQLALEIQLLYQPAPNGKRPVPTSTGNRPKLHAYFSIVALTKSRNNGCGRVGLDTNSGWNWEATNQG